MNGDRSRKRGGVVQYMVKDNEGHGFHNEENQFDFYGAMENFFSTYLREGVTKSIKVGKSQ